VRESNCGNGLAYLTEPGFLGAQPRLDLEKLVKKTGSWFALVTYCAAAALVAALGLSIVFTSASLVLGVVGTLEAEARATDVARTQNFAGMITDERCGARHMDSDKSPAACARACVRDGSQYSLIDGDKRYQLAGMYDQLNEVAGQRVRISGTLDGETIRVSAIRAELSTQR
jgi:hypothetical protein